MNRQGHGNQFHTHPGALWSATYYVDDGGIGADPSLGGEFEIQDPRGVAPVMYAPSLTFPGPDGAALGDKLVYEPSRGGDLFPHLYAPLPLTAVLWETPLSLGHDGQHQFPEIL